MSRLHDIEQRFATRVWGESAPEQDVADLLGAVKEAAGLLKIFQRSEVTGMMPHRSEVAAWLAQWSDTESKP